MKKCTCKAYRRKAYIILYHPVKESGSRSSVYGKIKHSTVSVTTKSLPKRPILQKSLNLTPHLLTDSLTGVSCCQKGTYKFLRKGFPKKAAVRLDFVRINPPSPPPNLDNLFHFYWTPMCQKIWAGVSPSLPIPKLTQFIQILKSGQKIWACPPPSFGQNPKEQLLFSGNLP